MSMPGCGARAGWPTLIVRPPERPGTAATPELAAEPREEDSNAPIPSAATSERAFTPNFCRIGRSWFASREFDIEGTEEVC